MPDFQRHLYFRARRCETPTAEDRKISWTCSALDLSSTRSSLGTGLTGLGLFFGEVDEFFDYVDRVNSLFSQRQYLGVTNSVGGTTAEQVLDALGKQMPMGEVHGPI
jgi:hypothetical protein